MRIAIDRALAIELRPAFAEAEQGTAAEQKRQRARLRIGSQPLDDLCSRSHFDSKVSRDFHLQAGDSSPGRSADPLIWPLRSHQGPVIKNGVAAGLQPRVRSGPSRRARQKHDAHRRTADCLRDDVEWAVVEGNQRPGAERRTFEQRATCQHVYRSVPRVTSAGTFCTRPFSFTIASMASSSMGMKWVKFSNAGLGDDNRVLEAQVEVLLGHAQLRVDREDVARLQAGRGSCRRRAPPCPPCATTPRRSVSISRRAAAS